MNAPLRVIVIDDEPPARQRIEDLLARATDVQFTGSFADAPAGLAAIIQSRPDVVITDIRMPRVSGLELVRALREQERPAFIFVTAHREHAPEAFDVAGVDYLLKPFEDERFFQALDRAREQIRLRRVEALTRQLMSAFGSDGSVPAANAEPPPAYLERLMVEAGESVVVLPVERIRFIQARGAYVEIRTADGRFILRERMKTLEERLDPGRFCRIHRSAIVAVDAIESLQPHWRGDYVVRLHDGTRLKLSRTRKPLLERTLGWG